jgi:L-aminopeptidase/D-esterase-like protein
MGSKNGSAISRREFARRAAFVSAAASLSTTNLLSRESTVGTAHPLQTTAGGPKLSAESQAEMESRIQAVFAQYGSRLNDAQKAELHRLAAEGQAGLDRLRAYSTNNGDGPGLYLKPLIEREKKSSPTSAGAKPSITSKNS